MLMRSLTAFLIACSALPSVYAQTQPPQSAPAPRVGVPTDLEQQPRTRNVLGATPPAIDVQLSDEVPLPGNAVETTSAEGVLGLQKGSGDPYYLGFVGSSYYPPPGERIDPKLISEVRLEPTDGRPAPTSYAFVMFSKRITDARLDELRAIGCRVLSTHPYYAVKVALPPRQIETVAALPYVRWIGSPRSVQKVHPHLIDSIGTAPVGESIGLIVNLYESDKCAATTEELIARAEQVEPGNTTPHAVDDLRSAAFRMHSNGWQQRALEALGVTVDQYTESNTVFAFTVHAPAAAVEMLASLDFVQFIEEQPTAQTMHDESTPLINSDSARNYTTGGVNTVVTAGEIDSGISYTHYDLTTHCNMIGWDFSGSAGGAFDDTCPHGTHVCGTITGNGYWNPANTGNAPGLGWGGTGRFFNAKIFNGCNGGVNLANVFNVFRNGQYDGGGAFTPKPMVINNSWGGGGAAWVGSEYECRIIDDEVFWQRQMYIFAAGNGGGVSTVSQEAGAKNAFAVGAVDDYAAFGSFPGNRSWFSSQGPMSNSRWKPNVCAPGDSITSLLAGSNTGYVAYGGTSMATPHVTGVAAQMCDANWWMRYNPPAIASTLMATAVTRGSQPIYNQYNSDLNLYGAGRIDAWLADYGTTQTGWSNWAFDLNAGQGTYADFYVSPGTTRVVICMNWNEQAVSAGASQATINDWDLYIDQEPFTVPLNSGEFTGGTSSYDNTEIRYIENPGVGNYRWKIHPYNATSTGHFGVTVYFVAGPIHPTADVSLTQSAYYVQPNQAVTMTASVYNAGYLSSGTYVTSSGGSYLYDSYKYLNDGAFADQYYNFSGGTTVTLGNILSNNTRTAYFAPVWQYEGYYPFYASAYNDNGSSDYDVAYVLVDGTAPSAPGPVSSPTHLVNTWSCDSTIQTDWSASSDNLSGVLGYSVQWDYSPVADPDMYLDTYGQSWVDYLPDGGPFYFHVRAVDYSGNWGPSSSSGPYYINTAAISTYCTAKVNSLFCTPYMDYVSRASTNGPDNFHLRAHNIINNKSGLMFWGLTSLNAPFQGGFKCVADPVKRTPVQSSGGGAGNNCNGSYDFFWSQSYQAAQGLGEGNWVYAQFWYRDPQSPSTTGLTDAVQFLICRN
jgi:hypothetical protein